MRNVLMIAMISIIALVSLSQAAIDTIQVAVREGETLSEFCERVGVSFEVLKKMNPKLIFHVYDTATGEFHYIIYPGDTMKIPKVVDDADVSPTEPGEVDVSDNDTEAPPGVKLDSVTLSWKKVNAMLDTLENLRQRSMRQETIVVIDTVIKATTTTPDSRSAKSFGGFSLFDIVVVFGGISMLGFLALVISKKGKSGKNPLPPVAVDKIETNRVEPEPKVKPENELNLEEIFTATKNTSPKGRQWKVISKDGKVIFCITDGGGTEHRAEMIIPEIADEKINPLDVRVRCPYCKNGGPNNIPPLAKNFLSHLSKHHPEVLSPKQTKT